MRQIINQIITCQVKKKNIRNIYGIISDRIATNDLQEMTGVAFENSVVNYRDHHEITVIAEF